MTIIRLIAATIYPTYLEAKNTSLTFKWCIFMHFCEWTKKISNSNLIPTSKFWIFTPPKFNIDPWEWWLEGYFPIGKVTFQGVDQLFHLLENSPSSSSISGVTKPTTPQGPDVTAVTENLYLFVTLQWTNIAMENPPFEDVFPIGKGGFPLPC